MLTRRQKKVQKDTVGYLSTIDTLAIQMNTIFEIQNNTNPNKNAHKLKSMFAFINQAI